MISCRKQLRHRRLRLEMLENRNLLAADLGWYAPHRPAIDFSDADLELPASPRLSAEVRDAQSSLTERSHRDRHRTVSHRDQSARARDASRADLRVEKHEDGRNGQRAPRHRTLYIAPVHPPLGQASAPLSDSMAAENAAQIQPARESMTPGLQTRLGDLDPPLSSVSNIPAITLPTSNETEAPTSPQPMSGILLIVNIQSQLAAQRSNDDEMSGNGEGEPPPPMRDDGMLLPPGRPNPVPDVSESERNSIDLSAQPDATTPNTATETFLQDAFGLADAGAMAAELPQEDAFILGQSQSRTSAQSNAEAFDSILELFDQRVQEQNQVDELNEFLESLDQEELESESDLDGSIRKHPQIDRAAGESQLMQPHEERSQVLNQVDRSVVDMIDGGMILNTTHEAWLDGEVELTRQRTGDHHDLASAWTAPIGVYRQHESISGPAGLAVGRSPSAAQSQFQPLAEAQQLAHDAVLAHYRPVTAATSVALGGIIIGYRKRQRQIAEQQANFSKLQ